MWGPSIIGFGEYQYTYESGHEGDAPLVGFSPRKAKISLYFATGDTKREKLLKGFGKHTTGKACVYINKIADVDVDVLNFLGFAYAISKTFRRVCVMDNRKKVSLVAKPIEATPVLKGRDLISFVESLNKGYSDYCVENSF